MPALERYRAKRDFKRTAEPAGRIARAKGSSYVIQKHAARRLHYDLRLELGGVLLSWAVTRGPSLVPAEKRLAVHVEDHPLDYADFEGTIPEGEYGGGSVIVWDRGSWQPIGDPRRALAKGHLEFELAGEKLAGRWHLIRMKGRREERRENWLLVKADDEAARGENDPDILEERPESVASGRLIEGIGDAAARRPAAKTRTKTRTKTPTTSRTKSPAKAEPAPRSKAPSVAEAGAMPAFIEPALATLRPAPPRGNAWIHEIKFDGYRLQAHVADGAARLLTRRGLDWTHRFGEAIVAALAALPVRQAVIDCEVVVENDAGASDFAALQAALSAGRTEAYLAYAFDLLHLDGADLRALPLLERKTKLQALLPPDGERLRFSDHFEQGGDMVLQHSCRLSLEGIISKRRDAPYRSGRSEDWVKSKCAARQEFVVGGYMPSTASSHAVGSLVLGVYDKGKLRHVGRVGTGFGNAIAEDLYRQMQPMRTETSPFAGRLTADQRRHVVFVRPELVAEAEFRGWTGDAQIRQASFRGLREDKPPEEIVRETSPAAADAPAPRRSLRLTHPDRVLWPDAGVTKEGLADYYGAVWREIAPFIAGRPLSLVRAPEGIDGERFFQKHAGRTSNAKLRIIRDPEASGDASLITIGDFDGLLALVQSAALEIHPWSSTAADLERPDALTLDLDPGPGVAWDRTVAAALEVKERLEAAGLAAFVKTSGGKGLHVVAPLKPRADWEEVKRFSKGLAESMARDDSRRYVAVVAKAKREGRILVDWLRNQRGATAVAAYSTRARPGAPVSMPLAWEELGLEIRSDHFTVENAPARLSAVGHAWTDFRRAARPIEAVKAKRAR